MKLRIDPKGSVKLNKVLPRPDSATATLGTSYNDLSELQTYAITIGEKTYVIDDHRLATINETDLAQTHFFDHAGGLSIGQWTSKIGTLLALCKLELREFKKELRALDAQLYAKWKSLPMSKHIQTAGVSKAELQKLPTERWIEVWKNLPPYFIDENGHRQVDKVHDDYCNKLEEVEELEAMVMRLEHSLSTCKTSLEIIRSLNSNQRNEMFNGV